MKNYNKLTLSALFLAMGIVLPMLTGHLPQIGSMLLPMHIPVFLCGFICGWQYGVPMAIILPLLRSMLFSRPNFYPEAIAIAFEMATYASVSGLIYNRSRKKGMPAIYRSLIFSMISGRIVRGAVQLILLGLKGLPFTFEAFFAGIVLKGLPGIILQFLLIPLVLTAIKNSNEKAAVSQRNKQ